MSGDRLMRIHSPEFQTMAERVLPVTQLTSRLKVMPFEPEAGNGALLEQILRRPVRARVTIYAPLCTDHGLHLELAERVSSTRAARPWTTPASGSARALTGAPASSAR